MAYSVQINYDEPLPKCCSDCRFNYDWLYCTLDMDNRVTTHDEGRPQHCKLMPTADVREVISSLWIPVSERLPEPRTICLITTTYGDVEFVCFTGKVWWLGEDQSDYWTKQVLAWMPAPDPYRGAAQI